MLYILDQGDKPLPISHQDYFLIDQQRRENRHIIYCDRVGDRVISTVFLFFSQDAENQQPLLFEVAVFKNGSLQPEKIKRFTRCSEAKIYHKKLFSQFKSSEQ